MKAHELAKKLLECPDFEVVFVSDVTIFAPETLEVVKVRSDFNNLEVYDIGYSDRVVVLGGNEVF